MHHPKGFPSRLVRLRAEADMTQKELSRLSGVSVPQIARYETGASKPRMNALVKLARALKVDVSALEDADDEPEVFEMALIDEDGSSEPIAIKKSNVDRLRSEAEKYGVTLETMLAAVIEFAHAQRLGLSMTFKEALAKSVDDLQRWPLPPAAKPPKK